MFIITDPETITIVQRLEAIGYTGRDSDIRCIVEDNEHERIFAYVDHPEQRAAIAPHLMKWGWFGIVNKYVTESE